MFSNTKLSNFKYLQQVSSTSDEVLKMAQQNAPEFACCFAESQSLGRGRLERKWQTFAGKSLAFSFLLYDFVEQMPLVFVCSVHKVLKEKYQADVQIKWPNDIYYQDKKLSGILVESFPIKNKRAFIVGIGLNALIAEENDLPIVGFLEPLTNVRINRESLFLEIFEQLKLDIAKLRTEGFDYFYQYFTQNCKFLNQQISIIVNNQLKKGIFKGINSDGHLILQTKESIVKVSAGEIIQEIK